MSPSRPFYPFLKIFPLSLSFHFQPFTLPDKIFLKKVAKKFVRYVRNVVTLHRFSPHIGA